MFDAIIRFIRIAFAEPQRDELLIRVRVEEEKPLYKRR